ncbi:MAG: DUF3782 domain-containing protein [Candidatus Binatia bacterium]|nr:DUF3782 domain-containing protein [Candidatus Binatia bacterium]
MTDRELIEQLRTHLPRLLREHPEVRYELWGMMLEAFPSRQEFVTVLEELRALREEGNRRFEVMERRFEAMDRRFEAVDRRFEAMDRRFEELRADMNQRFEAVDRRFEAILATLQEHAQQLRVHTQQLRDHFLHLSSLGGRFGHGLESVVKAVVEEFADQTFPAADRLVLWDERGEVFGVPKAEIEFDLYVHNSRDYLVEVKSHLKVSDVLAFHRKVEFAREKMGRPFIPLIIALSMDPKAELQMQALGIHYRIGPGGVVAESRSSPS